MKKKDIVYIGVVGQIASGKGVLVDYLVKNLNFKSFSLSSIIHQELKKRRIENFTRKTLQDVGDKLRKQYGDDVLARKAIKLLQKHTLDAGILRFDKESGRLKLESQSSSVKLQNPTSSLNHQVSYVIEGIRNPAEVKYLKSLPNFILIGVKAYRKIRYQRLLKRRKPWDPDNWSDFIEVDRRDYGIGQDKSGQQVGKCLAYCDYVLTNNKDIEDFQYKLKKIITKIIKY